jgi:hypothetical protein
MCNLIDNIMAKISWVIYIVLGLLFSISSYVINNMQNNNSLTIFIYVGYLFIGYGVSKLVVKYILGKNNDFEKNLDKKLPDHGGMPKTGKTELNINKNNHVNHNLSDNSKSNSLYGYMGYCERCNTPMRNLNRYCHRCGLRQQAVK